MIKSRLKTYWKEYSTKLIRLDQFAISKMGLMQSQTVLKLDDIMIVCAPYQISMRKAVLFVVLNPAEIPYFSRYIEKLAALKLTFHTSLQTIPVKFFIWVYIRTISAIQGKENMCLIEVEYKACPESLVDIVGNYISRKETLEKHYDQFIDKEVFINRDSTTMLGYNNVIECFIGNRKIEAKLISMAVNRLTLSIPGIDPHIKEGYEFSSKLYFKAYRFMVKGKVKSIEKTFEGFLRINYTIQYTPELLDILYNYFAHGQPQAEDKNKAISME